MHLINDLYATKSFHTFQHYFALGFYYYINQIKNWQYQGQSGPPQN